MAKKTTAAASPENADAAKEPERGTDADVESASAQVVCMSLPAINNQGPPPDGDRPFSTAGDEIRTHDIHVGNVTLYH